MNDFLLRSEIKWECCTFIPPIQYHTDDQSWHYKLLVRIQNTWNPSFVSGGNTNYYSLFGRCLEVSWRVILYLEKAMATHSSTLTWKIPGTEEPGRLQSMGSRRVGYDWVPSLSLFTCMHALEKEMAAHSSVLAWRSPGTAEPGGLPSMGSHRVGHDWNDLAAAAETLMQVKNPFLRLKLHPFDINIL